MSNPSFGFLIKKDPGQAPMLYTSSLVSLKERLYFLNKLFVKQVKSFYLLLDQDPFIVLCSLHNK